MKRCIINFVYFSKRYFFLFHFVLQQSISDMTARWSKIPAPEKADLIELEMRLVISRSALVRH